ncbi:MAG: zf-HC2 domain-containing protein, partial [Planctomycetes bacterium]|nr:zf-HC2 domain-containing protein [Planctomycetota bacterium]
MTDCRHVLDDLAAWRAGALDDARAAAVDAHLGACGACA